MNRPAGSFRTFLLIGVASVLTLQAAAEVARAQPGLRESLVRLDKNEDGMIAPDEITTLARPYLERITRSRRMSLEKPLEIDRLLDAARIHYALRNGVSGRDIRPGGKRTVLPFGPKPGQPLVPDFGLEALKYRYVKADLDEADRTLGRYDSNRDGFIDVIEAARNRWTHRDPFNMDLNKDGRLSRMELAQRYARRRLLEGSSEEVWRKARRTGGLMPQTRRVRRVGEEELERRRRTRSSEWWRKGGNTFWLTASVLGRFDANRNGRLEPEEAAKIGIPSGQIDADRDGDLSRDELHKYLRQMQAEAGEVPEGLPAWFYEKDANRDGQVAMSEFTKKWSDEKLQEFTAMDANRDGLLTAAEVSGSKSLVGGRYFKNRAEVLPPRKTIVSEIEVDDDFRIADLDLQLSITHSNTSFLDAYLTGPDGQRIELFTEVGGRGDNFDQTRFDDDSETPITRAKPPFKGKFMPEGASRRQPGLNHFRGKSIRGVWQLVIRGSRSERFGMLHSWGLIARPEEEGPPGRRSVAPDSSRASTPELGRGPDARSPRAESEGDDLRRGRDSEERRRLKELKRQRKDERKREKLRGRESGGGPPDNDDRGRSRKAYGKSRREKGAKRQRAKDDDRRRDERGFPPE